MKNVTITLDEATAAWARTRAAAQGKSVSRFVGELLQERMRDSDSYESGEKYLTREEVHDRARFRR
jgi:hypothetical protein